MGGMPVPHIISVRFTTFCRSPMETGYEKNSMTGEGWEGK